MLMMIEVRGAAHSVSITFCRSFTYSGKVYPDRILSVQVGGRCSHQTDLYEQYMTTTNVHSTAAAQENGKETNHDQQIQ